jgi:hypothetical protein
MDSTSLNKDFRYIQGMARLAVLTGIVVIFTLPKLLITIYMIGGAIGILFTNIIIPYGLMSYCVSGGLYDFMCLMVDRLFQA